MQTARDEMRDFASQRSEVLLELASCTVAAVALWIVAGRLDGALPELKALFFALLVAFGVGVQNLVPHLIPVLAFRCPRCTMLFHAATPGSRGRKFRAASRQASEGQRLVLSLRACAHCGLQVHGSDSPHSHTHD
jgi:hypothetical protein